jgi:hypothetical protein
MTRSRLAAIAALSIFALLVTTTGGEAQRGNAAGSGDFRVRMTCKTAQRTARDFAKITTKVFAVVPGGGRQASAARLFPVENTKVVTKLRDLTRENGNDVVDGKDADRTNEDGVAKTKLEFDGKSNYRAVSKAKIDGQVVGADSIKFGVADDESGKCDPPVAGY